ncbi:MAG: hypothetical protein DRR19_08770 [Candidatus Parabeggiatoa sp. nov. 1]|nr:MAG: hypothetical protein DRR19_08770 [Gammaproteobacteria bacterium]
MLSLFVAYVSLLGISTLIPATLFSVSQSVSQRLELFYLVWLTQKKAIASRLEHFFVRCKNFW